jgi:hypothetical protein
MLLLVAVAAVASLGAAQTVLLPFRSTWRYWDGAPQTTSAWYGKAFSDVKWATGGLSWLCGDVASLLHSLECSDVWRVHQQRTGGAGRGRRRAC